MNPHFRRAAVSLTRYLMECLCPNAGRNGICRDCSAALKALQAIRELSEQNAMEIEAIDCDLNMEYNQ